MPIKFSCPHCKKGLSVKDHLAGRRAACPNCKKPLTIPKGSSTNHSPLAAVPAPTGPLPAPAAGPEPHPDAESAAAEAFADEPAAAAKEVRTVDFNCPFCDEELKLDMELAGKKTSCPQCRRIITVPQVETDKPKDWRKAAGTGPSGAKRPDVPQPEGAWGSAAAGHVSRDALSEAGVLPDRKIVPLTTAQKWTRRVVYGSLVPLTVVAGILVYFMVFGSSEQRTLKSIQTFADAGPSRDQVGRPALAVLDGGLGEYYLHSQRSDTAAKTKEQFEKAIKQVKDAGPAGESDGAGVLIDVAVAIVDLTGDKQQVNEGQRLDEKESQKLLREALDAIARPEARLEALRLVSRRMIAAHQGQRALSLATQVFHEPGAQSEAVATVGLELLAANETDLANKAAVQALDPFKVAVGVTPPPPPPPPLANAPAVALAKLLNKPAPKADSEDEQVAEVETLARQGRGAEAGQLAAKVEEGSGRLRALLAAAGENNPDKQTIEQALAAVPMIADALKGSDQLKLSWTVLHLIRLGAEAGASPQSLGAAANVLPNGALRARGHLLIVRGQLAHTDQAVGDDVLAVIDPKSAAQFAGRLELARHNIKANSGYAKIVEGWEEPYRPFGRLGTLLK